MSSSSDSRGERRVHRGLRRLAIVIGVPLAVLGGVRAVLFAAATLKTWQNNDVLTAADLNANFKALADEQTPGQIAAKVNTAIAAGTSISQSYSAVSVDDVVAAFTVPAGTFTKVPYKASTVDRLGEFNGTTSRFTAKLAGEYQVCASIYNPAGAGDMELDVFKNGVREHGFAWARTAADAAVMTGCRAVHLEATDYLEVDVWHSGTAALSYPTNAFWDWLTIHRIS